jgi:hypothetical protein
MALALAFNGHVWPYDTAFVSLLPGATMVFEIQDGDGGQFRADAAQGTMIQTAARQWKWTAPQRSGTYALRFKGPQHSIAVHAFVLVPARRVTNGALNGYRIGAYPPARARYQPPPGFIEVTRDNDDTRLSPHFRLEQFICKQEPLDAFPKYVALREELILALEAILERVKALGHHADTLQVMSAYRTPYYNKAIGDVPYSMHQWGAAADVFVATRTPGQMDDFTRDGRIDIDDARFLYDEIDRMPLPAGGLGYYPATAAHPPFVHVDARGTRARWKG